MQHPLEQCWPKTLNLWGLVLHCSFTGLTITKAKRDLWCFVVHEPAKWLENLIFVIFAASCEICCTLHDISSAYRKDSLHTQQTNSSWFVSLMTSFPWKKKKVLRQPNLWLSFSCIAFTDRLWVTLDRPVNAAGTANLFNQYNHIKMGHVKLCLIFLTCFKTVSNRSLIDVERFTETVNSKCIQQVIVCQFSKLVPDWKSTVND